MVERQRIMRAVLRELKDLAGKSFPKTCLSCGRTYASLDDFLASTQRIPRARGLLDEDDYDDKSVVDLIRLCACGTTLMVVFSERRDRSEEGDARRKRFDRLLDLVEAMGLDRDVAREELRKLFRGQDSAILREHGLDIDGTDAP